MDFKYFVLLLVHVAVGMREKVWFEGMTVPELNYTIQPQYPLSNRNSMPAEPVHNVTDLIVSRGLGRLALQMQSVLGSPGKNTVFSPLSVALAMGLVLLGAKGQTYIEITTALGLSNNTDQAVVEELHQVFGRLFQILEQNSDEGVLLTLASGVFIQKDFQIKPEYSETAKVLYRGEVMSLDFVAESDDSRKIINRWVDNRTSGHITNILTEPLSLDTRIVMVNAIFFNGNWLTPFPAEFTRKHKFHINSHNTVEVDMMINVADAFYFGDEDKKVLGLPYKGNETIMYFVRPNSDLDKFVASTTPMDLQAMVQNSTFMTTIYAVPRMKLEETVHLQEALEHLGVRSLFDPHLADLSGIAPGVYVNNILQKVEVIISETGTVASAATVVDLVRSGGPVVRLDKPFLFFIYDVPTKLVSFWGTVYNPLQQD